MKMYSCIVATLLLTVINKSLKFNCGNKHGAISKGKVIIFIFLHASVYCFVFRNNSNTFKFPVPT